MKQLRVPAEEIADAIPGDVSVVGIRWLNEEKDIALDLVFPGTKGCNRGELVCSWSTDLKLNLDQTGRIGVIPLWNHEISKLTDGRWRVFLDLSPAGTISLICNDLQLQIR